MAQEKLKKLNDVLQQDPGGRGLLHGGIGSPVEELYGSLKTLKRAVLLTGFPVRKGDGEAVGETDGPSGTANIAWALEQAGAEVSVLTDAVCLRQLDAAMKARGCVSAAQAVPDGEETRFLNNLFTCFAPTHLITLERPGKAKDGHYHNMRGAVIDPLLTDTDCIMEIAREHGACIISVGDGGNELGMGALRQLVEERVPFGELICADRTADIALVSGVSNWWGWGIAAVLSLTAGRDLLPSDETEREMLRAVIASGGADGANGRREETVDGLGMDVHLAVLHAVKNAVLQAAEAE